MEQLLKTVEGNFTTIISLFTLFCLLSIIAQTILEFLSEFWPFSAFFGIRYKIFVMKNNFPSLFTSQVEKTLEKNEYLQTAEYLKSSMDNQQLQVYKSIVANRCRIWAAVLISVIILIVLNSGDFANLYTHTTSEKWIATSKTEQINQNNTVTIISYSKEYDKERHWSIFAFLKYFGIALFIGVISSLGSNHWHAIMKKTIKERNDIPKIER